MHDITKKHTSEEEIREDQKLNEICFEFREGIDEIKEFGSAVTFYGSARLKEDHPAYKKTYELAYKISKELGYAILSGGGGGIMEAANRGAFDAGGESVGLTIRLPHEQTTNPFVKKEISFSYFFARQVSMSYSTEVCIFCPGGFGTFSELFEILTLQQTGKIGKIPIVLYGSDFWKPIESMIENVLSEKYKTISSDDINLYRIIDDEEEIMEIIRKSNKRDGEDALIITR